MDAKLLDPDVSLTGPQIVYLRLRLGFRTQAALARRIGSSQAAVSRKETNPEPMKGPEIMLIAALAMDEGIRMPTPEEATAALAGDASPEERAA